MTPALPLPPGWPAPPRRRWGPVVASVVAGTVFLAFGLVALAADGDAPWLALGLGVFWYAVGATFLPRGGPGMLARDGALVVPVSRLRTVLPLAGTVALGLGAAASVGWPWGLGIVAVYGVALPAFAYRGGVGGEVRLDAEGVAFAFRPHRRRLAWGEVGDVVAMKGRIEVTAPPGEGVWVRTDRFDADPLAVYWTLRFYATHPEARAELADGRALDRVRRGALADQGATSPRASGS